MVAMIIFNNRQLDKALQNIEHAQEGLKRIESHIDSADKKADNIQEYVKSLSSYTADARTRAEIIDLELRKKNVTSESLRRAIEIRIDSLKTMLPKAGDDGELTLPPVGYH